MVEGNTMKHVFITHSNITKIISEGIIETLQLKQAEVVIISFRNSTIPGYNNHELEAFRSRSITLFKNPIINCKKIWNLISTIDNIKELKSSYTLYTPQVGNAFFQIIASNPNCKKINFIEEGSVSYFLEDRVKKPSLTKKLFKLFIYRNRIPSSNFYDSVTFKKELPTEYFIFSEGAFKSIPNRRIVKINSKDSKIEDGTTIFVLDAFIEVDLGTENELIAILNQFTSDNKDESEISLKFHPQQSAIVEQKVLEILSANFKVILLSKDIILEKEFSIDRTKKLRVFGIVSTLLIYSQQKGHYSKTYLNFLSDKKNKFKKLKGLYESLGVSF